MKWKTARRTGAECNVAWSSPSNGRATQLARIVSARAHNQLAHAAQVGNRIGEHREGAV